MSLLETNYNCNCIQLSFKAIDTCMCTYSLFVFPDTLYLHAMDITNFDTTLMSVRLIVSISFTCCKKVWQKINEIKRETSS